MADTGRRILKLIFLNIISSISLLLPFIGIALSIKNNLWGLVPLFVLLFIIIGQLLFLLENRWNIRSPSNPDSYYFGSGVTIIAPWLQKKMKRMRQEDEIATKKDEKSKKKDQK